MEDEAEAVTFKLILSNEVEKEVSMQSRCTIRALKDIVANLEDMISMCIRLTIIGGTDAPIRDTQTLHSAQIKNGTRLHVTIAGPEVSWLLQRCPAA